MKGFSHRIRAIALATGVFSSVALAGIKSTEQVIIQDTGPKPFAAGDLGYARNTADQVQYIGCTSSPTFGICYAVNAAGLSKSCSTTDPTLMALIRSLNGDSYLFFNWNTDGTCRLINVSNNSKFAPK